MKDNANKKFMSYSKWMMSSFLLVLVNMLIPMVEAMRAEMSSQKCFLYPVSEYEPSPWYALPRNHDTVVVLEHMPKNAPVNITLQKFLSEDTYCLLTIRLSNLRIYGECVLHEEQTYELDGNIEDKTLVLHDRESIFSVSVEGNVIALSPVTAHISELNHTMPEWNDNREISEGTERVVHYGNECMVQITADISPENRLHAAFGCEYDTEDECTMEFGKTILCVEDEITLMAFSNSSELEGQVHVLYGTSEIEKSKPLRITLPSFFDDDTWEEVVTIVPTFQALTENKDIYLLFLDSSLIYSPRTPGLVGSLNEKKLILDFTKTENVRWGVPCPDKPVTLNNISTTITTTPENEAETILPDGAVEDGTNLMSSMVRGISNIDTIVDSDSQPASDKQSASNSQPASDYSQPELENLKLQLNTNSEIDLDKEGMWNEVSASVTSSGLHVHGTTVLILMNIGIVLHAFGLLIPFHF